MRRKRWLGGRNLRVTKGASCFARSSASSSLKLVEDVDGRLVVEAAVETLGV